MTSAASRPVSARAAPVALMVAALAIFVLAYASPVEYVSSDPALALVASQALVDHGTLDLEVYRGDPRLAYSLDEDYRLHDFRGARIYHSLALPMISAPFVWLANRAGLDMLDQEDEGALQNLLSALLTAGVFLLLYALGRLLAGPPVAFAVALVSTLGTSLTSTLATGLWSADFQVPLLCAALWVVVGRGGEGLSGRQGVALAALLVAALLIRPTTGLFLVGLLVYLVDERRPIVRVTAVASLVAMTAAVALSALDLLPFVPRYYQPHKILPVRPLGEGLLGALASPSRGWLVYSPFLVVVGVAVAVACRPWRRAWTDRPIRLVLVWMGLHLLAIAGKASWWGGHSFGPRLLTEIVPGAAVLACWCWRELSGRQRRILGAVYLALAVPAVVVHVYQGLFNDASRRWNHEPDVDRYYDRLWDWRHSQLLATGDSLRRGSLEVQRSEAEVYRLGETWRFDAPGLVLDGWSAAESAWRWSDGRASAILLRLGAIEREASFVLALEAGALDRQRVGLTVNGAPVGQLVFEGFEPVWRRVLVPGSLLRNGAENAIRFDLPDARPTGEDPRLLGLALRAFRLDRIGEPVVDFDDPFLVDGWSAAEDGWRWTDGPEARVRLALAGVDASRVHRLEIRAGALGRQRVEVTVNGADVGELTFESPEPILGTLEVPGELLLPRRLNEIVLRLPDAASPPGDPRRLGIALRSLRLVG